MDEILGFDTEQVRGLVDSGITGAFEEGPPQGIGIVTDGWLSGAYGVIGIDAADDVNDVLIRSAAELVNGDVDAAAVDPDELVRRALEDMSSQSAERLAAAGRATQLATSILEGMIRETPGYLEHLKEQAQARASADLEAAIEKVRAAGFTVSAA